MIDFSKHSLFVRYVSERLPEDYLITDMDAEWLDRCAECLEGGLTHANMIEATKRAVAKHGKDAHIDPFDLLIDAEICDARLDPL